MSCFKLEIFFFNYIASIYYDNVFCFHFTSRSIQGVSEINESTSKSVLTGMAQREFLKKIFLSSKPGFYEIICRILLERDFLQNSHVNRGVASFLRLSRVFQGSRQIQKLFYDISICMRTLQDKRR